MVELTDDPREREIFLRALRYYSDSCEPPELYAECPFSVDEGPGQRGCGEECMDLLATHNAPPATEEIKLGNGISIIHSVRPRARRAPLSTTKVYDARKVYLIDKATKPPQQWFLASVLQGLVEEIGTEPPLKPDLVVKRRDHIYELVRIVDEHGLDFEVQVMPHLQRSVIGPVLAVAFIKDQNIDKSGSEILKIMDCIISWVNAASFDELIDWKIPLQLDSIIEAHQTLPTPGADGQWIWDRFTSTFIDEWATESLRKEWKYIHGEKSAPCHSREMIMRVISEEQLAMVMADRLARSDREPFTLADNFVKQAIKFLEEERRLDAVILFEAAVLKEPENAKAHNNLGFCLLPDDPRRALHCFEKALELDGVDVQLVNVNRILALALLGRRASAMDLAQSFLDSDSVADPVHSWLWDYHSLLCKGEAKLIKCYNHAEYVGGMLETTKALNPFINTT